MSLGKPGHMKNPEALQQEPWDFDEFVRAYDQYATRFTGWAYTRNSDTPTLQDNYESRPESFPTIDKFAERKFNYEQR